MSTVSIIGTGIMACGLAKLFIPSDLDIVVIAHSDKGIKDFSTKINGYLNATVMDEDLVLTQPECRMIRITKNFEAIRDSDFVIECVLEHIDIKNEVIEKIERHSHQDTLIATNTSSLSINELSRPLKHPQRFLGIHFMNPAHIMKLVELISGQNTSQESLHKAKDLLTKLKKEYIEISDTPGFVVNRLLIPMINEAAKLVDQGIATAEDIDKAMVFGAGWKIGPIKLAKMIGHDVCTSILTNLHERISPSQASISHLLQNKKSS